MRHISCFIIFLCVITSTLANGIDYFNFNHTMRVDYYISGTSTSEQVSIDLVYQQGEWAGPKKNLVDPFDRGRYSARIFNITTNKLLFSKGYDSYFGEYKTTSAALNGISRTYMESVLLPFPKDSIRFELHLRSKDQQLKKIFEQVLDPGSVSIIKKDPDPQIQIFNLHNSGPAEEKVDVVLLGEGYTQSQVEKFSQDSRKLVNIFFTKKPFKSVKRQFNFYGVLKPSSESGCDEPTKGIYKNTTLEATFNSLSSPRYLLTEDMRAMQDVASAVPCDFMVVLVNSDRYGGGGIYNAFATVTSDNIWTGYVFIHEFGHLFAGLADEYYDSSTSYNDFYPDGIEPLEPNITRLMNPENVKWKKLITPGTPVPTPWDKKRFDNISGKFIKNRTAVNKQIAEHTRNNSSQTVIDSLKALGKTLSKEQQTNLNDIIYSSKFVDEVGVYEGAGYISTGMYRPMIDCTMFRIGDQEFCKVCQKAISEIIDHYSD